MRLLLALLLLSTGCLAQASYPFALEDEQVFHGGLNIGSNFCQVDGDGFSGYRKVGLAGGASVFVRIKPWLHTSLGIAYAQKGSRESRIQETYSGPAVFRYRIDLNYVEMPLLLNIHIGGRFHYHGGISYARLINWKEEAEDINPILFSPELYPFRKEDWSSIIGFSYRLLPNWHISGQYQYTIGSIRSGEAIPTGYGFGRQRNNVMGLRLVYIIKSGGAR